MLIFCLSASKRKVKNVGIIDTTGVIDSSMFLKARLPKNMVGSNYYIESLQHKVDREWLYRYNVIDIEEEKEKPLQYSSRRYDFSPVEAVIQHVISDKGEKLADDWKQLVFKDVRYKAIRGKRYRFSLDYEQNVQWTEAEKQQNSSIWLTVNSDSVSATGAPVVRRCNSNLVFAGSPTMDINNIVERHIEPCIIEDDLKYINIYTNDVVALNQAEIYATMQYNYYTKNIKPNDRFFVGNVDPEYRDSNTVFKVAAISRYGGNSTYLVGTSEGIQDIPLITISLNRDVISTRDNVTTRLTTQPSLYRVPEVETPTVVLPDKKEELPQIIPDDTAKTEPTVPDKQQQESNYRISVEHDSDGTVLKDEEVVYSCRLLAGKEEIKEVEFECIGELSDTKAPESYFKIESISNCVFKLVNLKPCFKSALVLKFRCNTPTGEKVETQLAVKLRGYY